MLKSSNTVTCKSMRLQCITIRDSQIASNLSLQKLLVSGIEDLFVVDLDAIFKNKFNFHTYQQLSKYFETVVMSLPLRVADLMDCFIAGADKVVISGRTEPKLLDSFMNMSDNLVLCYQDPVIANAFFAAGGKEFLSDRELSFPGSTVYSFSRLLSGENYIELVDFPREDLLNVLY